MLVSPYDDPQQWLRSQAFEAPLSVEQIAQVQAEIDGIIGTTRGNQSIAKLVWNGDVNYWKQIHTHWTPDGKTIGDPHKRPIVLYSTVWDSKQNFVHDAFVPRWLLLTRLEPEQFAATYVNDSRIFCPDRKVFIQVLPAECPPVRYVWYATIAMHTAGCCQRNAAEGGGRDCFGKYVHPRACLDELRDVRRGREEQNITDHPFDSPDQIAIRMREHSVNNYEEAAMASYIAQQEQAISETPMALADPGVATKVHSYKALEETLTEEGKRAQDVFAQDLRKKRLQG